jgi:hypothetical protein
MLPRVGDAPRYQHSMAPLFLNHPLQYSRWRMFHCSLGETFYETRLSRYISTAFVCGGSLGSGAPTPFSIEVTQQPTPSFVCESGRAGREYPYLPAGIGF